MGSDGETLDWWHANTPANERSETRRNQAYLRAHLRIANGMPLYAGGLLLDTKRLWMDRSVIIRCERDGFLAFVGGRDPQFGLTDKGREWLETGTAGNIRRAPGVVVLDPSPRRCRGPHQR